MLWVKVSENEVLKFIKRLLSCEVSLGNLKQSPQCPLQFCSKLREPSHVTVSSRTKPSLCHVKAERLLGSFHHLQVSLLRNFFLSNKVNRVLCKAENVLPAKDFFLPG